MSATVRSEPVINVIAEGALARVWKLTIRRVLDFRIDGSLPTV
jgi:hypothetical protein